MEEGQKEAKGWGRGGRRARHNDVDRVGISGDCLGHPRILSELIPDTEGALGRVAARDVALGLVQSVVPRAAAALEGGLAVGDGAPERRPQLLAGAFGRHLQSLGGGGGGCRRGWRRMGGTRGGRGGADKGTPGWSGVGSQFWQASDTQQQAKQQACTR